MPNQISFKAESRQYFDDLPENVKETFRKLAEKYKTGKVRYKKLNKDIRNCVDFKSMSVEEAIMLMFFLISEDAKKDLKEMLDQLEATRLKREALRLEENLLKKEISCLRKKFRKQVKRKVKLNEHLNSLQKSIKKYHKYKLNNEKPFLAYTFTEG